MSIQLSEEFCRPTASPPTVIPPPPDKVSPDNNSDGKFSTSPQGTTRRTKRLRDPVDHKGHDLHRSKKPRIRPYIPQPSRSQNESSSVQLQERSSRDVESKTAAPSAAARSSARDDSPSRHRQQTDSSSPPSRSEQTRSSEQPAKLPETVPPSLERSNLLENASFLGQSSNFRRNYRRDERKTCRDSTHVDSSSRRRRSSSGKDTFHPSRVTHQQKSLSNLFPHNRPSPFRQSSSTQTHALPIKNEAAKPDDTSKRVSSSPPRQPFIRYWRNIPNNDPHRSTSDPLQQEIRVLKDRLYKAEEMVCALLEGRLRSKKVIENLRRQLDDIKQLNNSRWR